MAISWFPSRILGAVGRVGWLSCASCACWARLHSNSGIQALKLLPQVLQAAAIAVGFSCAALLGLRGRGSLLYRHFCSISWTYRGHCPGSLLLHLLLLQRCRRLRAHHPLCARPGMCMRLPCIASCRLLRLLRLRLLRRVLCGRVWYLLLTLRPILGQPAPGCSLQLLLASCLCCCKRRCFCSALQLGLLLLLKLLQELAAWHPGSDAASGCSS